MVSAADREDADGVGSVQLQEAQSIVSAACACGLDGKHRRLLSTGLAPTAVPSCLPKGPSLQQIVLDDGGQLEWERINSRPALSLPVLVRLLARLGVEERHEGQSLGAALKPLAAIALSLHRWAGAMGYPPDFDESLPDIYRSREAFFASLPAWRRFLAKLNWHPIIDLMVERYAREQEQARRQDRLAKAESSPDGDALLAELNAELSRRGSTRTTIADLPAEPTAPRPDQTRTAPAQPSRRNAVKATLLLLLGIGIAILLFTSPWFWLLLVAGCAVWVVFGFLAFIWKAIYDTLQEGDQPPPP